MIVTRGNLRTAVLKPTSELRKIHMVGTFKFNTHTHIRTFSTHTSAHSQLTASIGSGSIRAAGSVASSACAAFQRFARAAAKLDGTFFLGGICRRAAAHEAKFLRGSGASQAAARRAHNRRRRCAGLQRAGPASTAGVMIAHSFSKFPLAVLAGIAVRGGRRER